MTTKLKYLKPGQVAKICGYEESVNLKYKSKLLSFGLTKGVTIKMIRVAPLGDPLQIEVRGFQLTLRKDESDVLIIEADLLDACAICKKC